MSKTTSERRFAARVFAVMGGALLGLGIACVLAALAFARRPIPDPGVGLWILFVFLSGVIALLVGGVLAFTSVVVRGPHRIGHLVGWVLVPAALTFVVASVLLAAW